MGPVLEVAHAQIYCSGPHGSFGRLRVPICGWHPPPIPANFGSEPGTAQTQSSQAAPKPEVFTRASVTKDTTGPVILVSAPKLKAKASLNMIQENGPTRTYVSDDGIVLLLQHGLLAGSRGFGDDLMSSEHAAAHRAILKGSGRYERVLRHINSQNHLEAQALSCSLTDHGAETVTILGHKHGVLRRVETCDLAGRQIENIFWVAEETIWKSQQWVSDQIGSLTIAHVQ